MSVALPPVDPAARVEAWTTPRLLRTFIGLAQALSLALFLVGLRGLTADRADLKVFRGDTAPGIVAAQELAAHLADLDAQLAASLLGSPGDRDVAGELFELRRATVTRRLVEVAGNLSLGDVDRVPVVSMSEELGRYLEVASRAQWLYASGDRDAALATLRIATDEMHERILPQAAALDRAKRDQMDQRHDSALRASRLRQGLATGTGAVLVAVLLVAQVFVRVRMRRRVVPMLLLATGIAIAFTSYLTGRLRIAREDLRVARDDAFDSVHLLWKARALAYDARGDEARWLLDRPRAGIYEAAFLTKTSQLQANPGAASQPGDSRGLLADELRNITFTGEREAATAAVAALARYVGADERLRKLENTGRHADAVEVCIGPGDVASRASFDRLDAALERTTAINQDAFVSVLSIADRGLRRAEWLDPALALGIALFTWLGLRRRLAEFAG